MAIIANEKKIEGLSQSLQGQDIEKLRQPFRNVFNCWHIPKDVEVDRVRFLCKPGKMPDYKDMDVIILSSSIMNKEDLYPAIKKRSGKQSM